MATATSSTDVPPFIGYVETTVHALRLIHAARQGVVPRITRRLNDTERRAMIKSGAVFVFSVEESGIKRWTDGLLWSPSRIVGNFLVYREINERASSRGGPRKPYPLDGSQSMRTSPGYKGHSPTNSCDHGTFKPNGLIKKTITVTIEGSDLHLISYYTSDDIRSGKLRKPSSRHDIMNLHMPPHIFRLTNFRVPPKIEIGPDGKPRLVTEPEDSEHLEPKMEEATYNLTHSPSSSASPTTPENPFTGSMYMNHDSYSRTGGDRWAPGSDISRVASPARQEFPWPPLSPVSTHPSIKREVNDVWAPMHSSRYESSVGSSTSSTYDRLRSTRLTPAPYHYGSRDSDSSYGSRHSTSRHREGSAHRLPWLLNQDSTTDNRDLRNSCRPTGYTPSSSISNGYSSGQYSSNYAPAWTGSGDESSLGVSTPPSTPFGSHSYAAASYSSHGSGGYDS